MVVRVRLGVVAKKGISARTKTKLNSVALVRERTIPTERPPPVTEKRTVIDQPAGRNIAFSCGEVSLTTISKNVCNKIAFLLNIRV
jgi:hypothetical protein